MVCRAAWNFQVELEHRATKYFNSSGGWLGKRRYKARKIAVIDIITAKEQGQCNSPSASLLHHWEAEQRERVLGHLSEWTSRDSEVLRSDLSCRRQNASHITNTDSFAS